MIRSYRFSIAGLMGAVVVAAIAVAAMRRSSETWAGVLFLFTSGALCLAVIGLVCRGPAERAWWLGFNLFGWGYWKLAFWDWSFSQPVLPTTSLLKGLGFMIGFPANDFELTGLLDIPGRPFLQAGHSFWTLIAAILGGKLASAAFGASANKPENTAGTPPPTVTSVRGSWRWLLIFGTAAIGLVVAIALSGSILDPELKAGAIYLLTRGMMGALCLGALLGPGKAREICLGAALFGVGYLFMAFDRSPQYDRSPDLPTAQLLTAVRVGFPTVMRAFSGEEFGVTAANTRILNLLEQPIPMPFRDDATPLGDIIEHIESATRSLDGKGISIHVDPIGMGETERSITSTVLLGDLEGVPLKTSLRLCMNQLGLRYEVTGGTVVITAADRWLSDDEDTFTTAGQCLLALIAAAVGGVLGPLVSGLRRRPVTRLGDGV
jgi:hypothetical protein